MAMDYARLAAEQHRRLEEHPFAHAAKLNANFRDVADVVSNYEELACRAALILGDNPPKDNADRCVRDLFADSFDSLHASRRVIFEGYASIAFPLLRRAFECNSLIEYFIFLPDKANGWDNGEQIHNAEIRKYLDDRYSDQHGATLKRLYAFFSEAAHPNRAHIPYRHLGEPNQFVLGPVGVPNLFVVAAGYLIRLLELWYSLSGLIYIKYEEVLTSADSDYGPDHMAIQKRAVQVSGDLDARRQDFWKHEYGERASPVDNTA